MSGPGGATLDLITQLCNSRAGELQGLPSGCMPGSMCAASHLYAHAFWMMFGTGVFVGICAVRAYQTHMKNRKSP